MSGKLDRQKINERDEFTYEEREKIARKSDHRCAHCGRMVYFGYGATIDHFVPLSRGGTNRDINLIMLCDACNKEKGDMILLPGHYVKFLKDEHYKKLKDYFESYEKSFEYIGRRNILSCDRYALDVIPPAAQSVMRHNKSYAKKYINIHYLCRATLGDIPRLTEYFARYLDKYGLLDDIEAARANIEFWMRFGCIYYIEKDDDIKLIMTATVTDDENRVDDIAKHMTFNIFSYYSTDYALALVKAIMDMVSGYVMEEQGLSQLPSKYCMVAEDKLSGYALGMSASKHGAFRELYAMHVNPDNKDRPPVKDDKALAEFFAKFRDVSKWAREWIEENYSGSLEWMMGELVEEWEIPASLAST